MPAGTVVVSVRGGAGHDLIDRPVRSFAFNWTADGSGAVSGYPSVDSGGGQVIVSGLIMRAVFVPGSPAQSPSGCTIALLDRNGIDVLAGWGTSSSGGNMSSTNVVEIGPALTSTDGTNIGVQPFAVDEQLTLVVTGAGAAAQGSLLLYVR